MFVRRAITVLSVLRAHPVTILGNLTGDPIRLRKGGDHIAHKLRFPNASRVPANNDHPPVLFVRRPSGHRRCQTPSRLFAAEAVTSAQQPVAAVVYPELRKAETAGFR